MKRILLVDDDESIRRSMTRLLAMHGYDVTPAANGKLAWELIKQSAPFDIIITDLAMPEMSGIEFAGKVNVLFPTIKIIMMSGNYKESDEMQAKEAGVEVLLEKPFSIEQLLEIIGV